VPEEHWLEVLSNTADVVAEAILIDDGSSKN